jgi:transcriptional regulator with XRE-family HTH domain
VLAVADDVGAGRVARRRRLAERRRALGLTQEDLAALLGMERSTVVRWERGATQPLPWIRPRLAQALQVPVSELAGLLGVVPASRDGRRPAAAPVPRQLPAAVAGFTGRASELAALTRMLGDAGAGAPGTVVISAIGGTAGVGKTALAVYWAHQVAHWFGGGQLYVNLRGFPPAGLPATPGQAIRAFLDALGVPAERIPAQPDAQAGLYRSLVRTGPC